MSCAKSVFFCNSGAEANESAIKLIKKYGNKTNKGKESIILAAESSFHGRTLAALSATGQPKYQKGVLVEPIQGEGGVIPGSKIFFKSLREICDKYNSLLILDEVQSGVGRTGKMWGYENLGIEPDGFTLAKGLGGGHAIGALLVKEKANIFSPGDHASTFGGNPFACKAALTVLEEINRRNIINNVYLRGEQLSAGFEELSKKFPNIISGKRGLGLIQGLVINDDYADAKKITLKAFDKGLLVVPAGGNVVRIVPPLVISRREINILLDKLNSIFEEL